MVEHWRGDTERALVIFTDYLRSHAMSLTRPRKAILRAVMAIEGHFRLPDLFAALDQQGDRVNRATVFRVLPFLEDSGLLRRVCRDSSSQWVYEHIVGHEPHEHLVCVDCGRVVEVDGLRMDQVGPGISRDMGFSYLYHRLSIFGICPDCSKLK